MGLSQRHGGRRVRVARPAPGCGGVLHAAVPDRHRAGPAPRPACRRQCRDVDVLPKPLAGPENPLGRAESNVETGTPIRPSAGQSRSAPMCRTCGSLPCPGSKARGRLRRRARRVHLSPTVAAPPPRDRPARPTTGTPRGTGRRHIRVPRWRAPRPGAPRGDSALRALRGTSVTDYAVDAGVQAVAPCQASGIHQPCRRPRDRHARGPDLRQRGQTRPGGNRRADGRRQTLPATARRGAAVVIAILGRTRRTPHLLRPGQSGSNASGRLRMRRPLLSPVALLRDIRPKCELSVLVPSVVGDLGAEPLRGRESFGLGDRVKLNFHHD